ncbi:MAG: ABC transporter permease [Chloroflexota bacterium]|nr:ABC transporter permease [Chloroflexota bacterium]
MQRYVVQRLLQGVLVLLGVTLVTFLLVRLTGDPAIAMLGPDATSEQIADLRERMGFDDPLLVQYGRYLVALSQGDFGDSFLYRQPAFSLILERLPATFELTFAAVVVTLLISFPLGILSAVKRDSYLDRVSALFVFGTQAMPVFWAGILGIMVFSIALGWLPASGRGGLASLVMPATVLGLHSAAYQTRLLRSAMLDVLSQDYVRTARSKGLSEFFVVNRHALKNALIPVLTATGLQFATLVGGAVITEAVFAWPGVGSLAVQAINNRDIPLVMAATFVFAVIILVVNLMVDLSYGFVDPRVRLD